MGVLERKQTSEGPDVKRIRGLKHPALYELWPLPRPPNVPPLRALWSLLDGICGILKGSWEVLVIP